MWLCARFFKNIQVCYSFFRLLFWKESGHKSSQVNRTSGVSVELKLASSWFCPQKASEIYGFLIVAQFKGRQKFWFCDHSSGSDFLNVFPLFSLLKWSKNWINWISLLCELLLFMVNCWSCSLLINLPSIFLIHWLVFWSLRRRVLSTTKIFSLRKKPENIHIYPAGEETFIS